MRLGNLAARRRHRMHVDFSIDKHECLAGIGKPRGPQGSTMTDGQHSCRGSRHDGRTCAPDIIKAPVSMAAGALPAQPNAKVHRPVCRVKHAGALSHYGAGYRQGAEELGKAHVVADCRGHGGEGAGSTP